MWWGSVANRRKPLKHLQKARIKIRIIILISVLFIFLMATRMDTTAPYIMAQSALLEPSGLPHPNNGYAQDQPQEIASVLRRVMAEQDGNTNPTQPQFHHTNSLNCNSTEK